MSQKQTHTPVSSRSDRHFARRVTIATVIVLLLTALALLVWYSVQVLLLIFSGVLLAILLRALSDLVGGWSGLSHRWSLAIVIVTLVLILALAGWLFVPPLLDQLGMLADRLPAAAQGLRDKALSTRIGRLLMSGSPKMNELMSGGYDLLGSVTGIVSTTFGALVTLLVVLFTAVFLAANPPLYIRGFLRLVPLGYRNRAGEVLGAIGYTLKWWLIGQGVAMVVIGIATGAGLWLIGVPLAMALGFLAALFNFIPNFGPLISAVPATLLALAISPEKALWVIGLYIVLQNAEGYLISPNIQRKAVDLPQALSIIAQVLMGILAGGLGFVMATPLAAAVHVAVRTLYVEDLLGDNVETPADQPQLAEVREVRQATADMKDTPATKHKDQSAD